MDEKDYKERRFFVGCFTATVIDGNGIIARRYSRVVNYYASYTNADTARQILRYLAAGNEGQGYY